MQSKKRFRYNFIAHGTVHVCQVFLHTSAQILPRVETLSGLRVLPLIFPTQPGKNGKEDFRDPWKNSVEKFRPCEIGPVAIPRQGFPMPSIPGMCGKISGKSGL